MLAGKIIITTRQEGTDDLIGRALENQGATVLSMPLIEIHPLQIPQQVKVDIDKGTYQWVVFTSKNGVDHFFNQLNTDTISSSPPFKTAVFGKRTAMALKERGLSPDIVNFGNSAGDLLPDLLPNLRPENKVLLVLGNLAPILLQKNLAQLVKVSRLDVYHTAFVSSIDTEVLQTIAEDKYDLILFTSPSGFNSFKHHTGQIIDFSKLKIACLGPTTEETVIAGGIKPLVVAKPSGKVGLIKGIEDYFTAHSLAKTTR